MATERPLVVMYRESNPAFRLSVIGIIVVSLFVAMFARLGYLQVIDSPELAAAAKANQVRTLYVEAPRGRIVDRNGAVLAGNREQDVITVQRDAPKKDETLLPRLADFLHLDLATLLSRFNDNKASQYKPIPVASNVPTSLIAAFRERESEFPGVAAETQVQRWYPNGMLAAHLLGYVGEINDGELAARKNQQYRLGDTVGKSGVEATFEDDLRGKPGIEKVEVDAQGRVVRVLDSTPAIAGHDVELALDLDMQKAAEQSLGEMMQLVQHNLVQHDNDKETPSDRGAAVVAIDPRDGGVLVMASYPSFNPESFAKGIPQEEYKQLTDPQGSLPLNNRAVQGQYAPGSTFKLISSIAALKSGVMSSDTTINDGGSFVIGNLRLQNAQGKSYGVINMARALTVSSDVYYYTLGSRVWDARKRVGNAIQNTAEDFGFGETSGIALGSEQPGRVPTPDNRKKLHQQYPNIYPEGNWYAGDNVNLSIGQGDMLVTPLQLANAYATFANGGTLYKPKVVNRVLDTSGKPLRETAPQVIRHVDLPASIRQPIEQGLIGVVKDIKGTAYGAFNGFNLAGFGVAGKTGTAQVTGKEDSALFSAYGPVDGPRVALSVVLEQSGWGSTYAAPVGRQIFAVASGQSMSTVQLGTGTD